MAAFFCIVFLYLDVCGSPARTKIQKEVFAEYSASIKIQKVVFAGRPQEQKYKKKCLRNIPQV